MRAAENNDTESSTTADFDYENIDSDDYFYFPSHTPAKRELIPDVIKDLRARQAVMTSTIVANLLNEKLDKNIVRMGSSTLKETVNYWDW